MPAGQFHQAGQQRIVMQQILSQVGGEITLLGNLHANSPRGYV
jgi:hypothetical protein